MVNATAVREQSTDRNTPKNFRLVVSMDGSKIDAFKQYLGTFELVDDARVASGDNEVVLDINASDAQIQDFLLFGIYIYPDVQKVSVKPQ